MQVIRRQLICAIVVILVPFSSARAAFFFNFHCGRDDQDKVTREAAAKYFLSMSEIYKGLSQLELRNPKLASEQFSSASKHLADAKGQFERITKSSCFRPKLQLDYKQITETDIKFLVLIFEYFGMKTVPEEMISAESLGFSSKATVPRTLGVAVTGMLDATSQILDELAKYQKKGTPQNPKDGEAIIASTTLLTRYGLLVSKMTEQAVN